MTQHKSWTGTHPSLSLLVEARQERDAWKARAEAAEQRIRELEAQRDSLQIQWVDVGCELGQFADDLIAALKLQFSDDEDEDVVLAAIVARVTELKAQLAAQTWQPMDGENYPRDPNQKIQMIVDGYCAERDEWQTDILQEIRMPYRCIRGWRPINPPQEAQ